MRQDLRLLLGCLSLMSVLGFTPLARGHETEVIYVSPAGDDAHSGVAKAPVRTPVRAQELVRERLKAAGHLPKRLEVELRPGVHFLEQPLVFTPDDVPPEGTIVVYRGADDAREAAVLSGGRPLGAWRVEGNVWKIDIPAAKEGQWAFRDLYVNGQRRTRARTPNNGYFRVQKTGPDRRTSFTFKPGDLKPIANPAAAEIVFLHDWSISRIPVKAIDETTSTISFLHPIGNAAPHYAIDHFESNPRYYLENAPEYLDAPGEWYLDTAAGVLSYLPLEGEDPAQSVAIAPQLESVLHLRGTAERPVERLRFSNLQFAHTHWPLPEGGYAGSQASFHEDRSANKQKGRRVMVPAAITADLATGCEFVQCHFTRFGGSGLYFREQCHGNIVRDCLFSYLGANGLMIGETFTRETPAADGPPQSLVSSANRVEDCRLHHCGELDFGAVGIWIGIARDTVILHNELSQLPYTGISVGWRWDPTPTGCRGNIIQANHIHDVMQAMSDGGGIYTLGNQPGTKLVGNRIYNVPLNAGRAESNGIFMDEGTSEVLVENNTIYNIDRSPIRFHKAERDTLRNNRLVSAPGVPAFRYNNARPETMQMENNELLEASNWTPPADDPTAGAGPRE